MFANTLRTLSSGKNCFLTCGENSPVLDQRHFTVALSQKPFQGP